MRCPQLHFKGSKFQLVLAENPTKSALAALPRLPSAQTANGMDPLRVQSGVRTIFECADSSSTHQMVSPGPPQRPGLQLSAENQQKQQSQAHRAWQELKPAQ